MRVIAGQAKGRYIKVPGEGVRPATELVRGAIFSCLENLDLDLESVLDLFSGSGSLGIEALSRGAEWVDFVDRNKRCCAIIKENLVSIGFIQKSRIYCVAVGRAIDLLDKEYSLILMDPPYRSNEIDGILERLAASPLVGRDTIVCSTHSSRRPLQASYRALKAFKHLKHGDSIASFYSTGA